jgi:biotin carboxyl carrier protein
VDALSRIEQGNVTNGKNSMESSSSDIQLPYNKEYSSSKNIPSDPNEMMHPLGRKKPISSDFGLRNIRGGSRNHKGIDIATSSGSPVYAPLDGTVEAARDTTPNNCGGFIQLSHDNIYTKFCHLKKINVRNGQQVKKGQIIGLSGGGKNDPMRGSATGPHLHYEILNKERVAMNPVSAQSNLAEEVKKKPQDKITEFAKFVVKELGIKHPPTIAILATRDGLKTTANYDYAKKNKVIKIYGKGRMLVDVMRSLSHELNHHKQWEDGRLKVKPPDIGGPIEDESNAIAGQLIKKFALIDSTIYDE